MTDQTNQDVLEILGYASNIVAAHVSNNVVSADELPALINKIYNTLAQVRNDGMRTAHNRNQKPAVNIEDSITPDYLICLEDGKKLKMLKRHLKTTYNLTLDEYRQKWSLPSDYPGVAPNYARQRSQLAKNIGLGTVGRERKVS